MKEAAARIKINKLLENAGWRFFADANGPANIQLEPSVMVKTRGTIGNTGFYDASVAFDHIRINSGMLIFRPDATQLAGSYLYHFFQLENFRTQREAIVSGAAQPQLPIRSLNEATIPLPPLATQQAIVAEIEAEQALVAANRELITRFEQKIQATLARIWGEEKGEG